MREISTIQTQHVYIKALIDKAKRESRGAASDWRALEQTLSRLMAILPRHFRLEEQSELVAELAAGGPEEKATARQLMAQHRAILGALQSFLGALRERDDEGFWNFERFLFDLEQHEQLEQSLKLERLALQG